MPDMPPHMFDDNDDNDKVERKTSEMAIDKIEFAIGASSIVGCEAPHSPRLKSGELKNEAALKKEKSFSSLRINYLLVTMAIMLADGLQGTHLYVLYEGYGFSVANLYALGFVAGAITTPITGPLIDKFGRKRSALLYCILEIWINMLEQYPVLSGLVVSRVVGGVTTNLLSSVFETWLDTEYRRRGLDVDQYEIILRDSVVVSNISAIASGYLAHILAEHYGAVGPFRGAVTCTALALIVVFALWTENFGGNSNTNVIDDGVLLDGTKKEQEGAEKAIMRGGDSGSSCPKDEDEPQCQSKKGLQEFINDAIEISRADSRVLRVGIIQGLTTGSLQTFVFLWSPTLQVFAQHCSKTVSLGLDGAREPAYGLIFGAYMAAGVVGGFLSPLLRKLIACLVSPPTSQGVQQEASAPRPMAVEVQAAACYLLSAVLLFVPCMVSKTGEYSFSVSLAAFTVYEVIIGVMMPCEGVIRSLYLPANARATMLTLPRIIVNLAVACGVIITRGITTQSAFGMVSFLMVLATLLQLSLISKQDWQCILDKFSVTTTTSSGEKGIRHTTTRRFSFPNLRSALRRSWSSEVPELSDVSSGCDLSSMGEASLEGEWNDEIAVAAQVEQQNKSKLE